MVFSPINAKSQDSSATIKEEHGIGVSFSASAKDLFPSGAHPASYSLYTVGSYPGDKATGGVKLAAQQRIYGIIPPLPYTSSCRRA
jgi:hypothetical protein